MTAASSIIDERFPALRSASYRLLFVNGFFSTGARWTQVLGWSWLIHELTGSTTAVGVVTFASFVPFIFIGPVAGALADRIDRRSLLIWATLVGVAAAAALAAVTLTGVVEAWHVILLALLSGCAQASSVPARQALIANTVPREHLLNAVALSGVTQQGSRIVGPLFGAALLATLGAGAVFVLATALLGVGFLLLLRIRVAPAPGRAIERGGATLLHAVGSVGGDLRDAARYVARDRRVGTLIAIVGFHCGLTMAFDAMMPSLATHVGGGSGTFSAIIVGLGAGAIVGTVAISLLRSPAAEARAMILSSLGSGLAIASLGLAQSAAMVVAAAVFAGMAQGAWMALSAALLQRVVPDEYRGRVMALYVLVAAGFMAFVNLGFGRAADSIDLRLLLVVPGVAWIAVFLIATVTLPQMRSLVLHGQFLPQPEPAVEPAAAAGGS